MNKSTPFNKGINFTNTNTHTIRSHISSLLLCLSTERRVWILLSECEEERERERSRSVLFILPRLIAKRERPRMRFQNIHITHGHIKSQLISDPKKVFEEETRCQCFAVKNHTARCIRCQRQVLIQHHSTKQSKTKQNNNNVILFLKDQTKRIRIRMRK